MKREKLSRTKFLWANTPSPSPEPEPAPSSEQQKKPVEAANDSDHVGKKGQEIQKEEGVARARAQEGEQEGVQEEAKKEVANLVFILIIVQQQQQQ